MFREMRRNRQLLSKQETIDIFEKLAVKYHPTLNNNFLPLY